MPETMGSSSETGISIFQNTNILKYAHKSVLTDLGFPLLPKNSSF